MATRNWSGAAGDGSWATAGNWDTAPITGDDIIINTTNSAAPDIDAGLTTAIDANSLTVGPGFSGKIGSASAALSIAVTNGGTKKFTYNGSGEFCKITGSVVNSEVQHRNGTLYVSGGTWGTAGVHNISGRMIIEAAAVMAGTWNVNAPAVMAIAANATAIPLLISKGGVNIEITARDVTASIQDGGTWTIQGDGQFTAHVIQSGTTRLWNTGTNAAITNRGGLLTLMDSRASSVPVITTYTPWPQAKEVFVFGHLNLTPGTTTTVGARLGAVSAATS